MAPQRPVNEKRVAEAPHFDPRMDPAPFSAARHHPTTSVDNHANESNETATPYFLQQTIVGVVRDCSTDHAQGVIGEMESYNNIFVTNARAARTGARSSGMKSELRTSIKSSSLSCIEYGVPSCSTLNDN